MDICVADGKKTISQSSSCIYHKGQKGSGPTGTMASFARPRRYKESRGQGALDGQPVHHGGYHHQQVDPDG